MSGRECMYGCCLSRIHQFEKVEQFFVTSPDNDASWAALEEMLTNAEDFYQALGLPYQVSTSGTCLLVLPLPASQTATWARDEPSNVGTPADSKLQPGARGF